MKNILYNTNSQFLFQNLNMEKDLFNYIQLEYPNYITRKEMDYSITKEQYYQGISKSKILKEYKFSSSADFIYQFLSFNQYIIHYMNIDEPLGIIALGVEQFFQKMLKHLIIQDDKIQLKKTNYIEIDNKLDDIRQELLSKIKNDKKDAEIIDCMYKNEQVVHKFFKQKKIGKRKKAKIIMKFEEIKKEISQKIQIKISQTLNYCYKLEKKTKYLRMLEDTKKTKLKKDLQQLYPPVRDIKLTQKCIERPIFTFKFRLKLWFSYNLHYLGTCFCCYCPLKFEEMTIGHIVSRATNPTHPDDTSRNLRCVCKECNSAMKTMNLMEFKEMLIYWRTKKYLE
jgi:5-methylcytosine-specific restriction endonuclease McrA